MIHLATLALALLASGGGTEPLTIHCPPTAKLACGASTDPSVTGMPTVTGGCGGETITFSDQVRSSACSATRFDSLVTRTWTVTDACGNTASCTQALHVLRKVVPIDVKPTSCPNPFQVGSGGVLPVAILGTATFDATTVDPTTVQIWTVNCRSGPVSPTDQISVEDVATPFHGSGCDCHTLGADGFPDLVLHFDKQEVRDILGPTPIDGFKRLVITARTYEGCSIVGSDCVRIQ
jgi:hypothetical protein